MSGKVLMVLGTMSSAGKSLLTAGLCHLYARRGVRVAPFKAQNMSNNAAVCADGSEIGRAQYTQALASGLEPTAEMNPILLKPQSDAQSQVVVMGRARDSLPAREYYKHKDELWKIVTGALDSLRDDYELVIAEGAGSPVEINLKPGDIVNMAVARYAQAPVLLVGDIDRGGIFAQMLGTLWLLEAEERELVKGLIVNKFRGDPALFYDGIGMLEELGGAPVLGVVPYFHHRIPEEDAVAIEPQNTLAQSATQINIAILRLPRISNFDEFDRLDAEPGVSVRYIDTPRELAHVHAVIIPGTKSTVADLMWIKQQKLDHRLREFIEQGGALVGICGGYQMLGTHIYDPGHSETSIDEIEGLNLLPIETVFRDDKATYQAKAVVIGTAGWLSRVNGQTVTGYEIHMGTTRQKEDTAWLEINRRGDESVSVKDGSISPNGRVWGCYLHGIFENAGFRHAWLSSLGWEQSESAQPDMDLNKSFKLLADQLNESLDIEKVDAMLGLDI